MVAVALELEHAVDEVLEHARAGDGAVLGHVADEDRGDTRLLGDAEQPRRRLAHLRHRARSRADLGRVERLDGVDHAHVGPLARERRAHRLELGLGQDLHALGPAQPRCAELHLRGRLLAGDEQRAPVAARSRPARSGAASTCRRPARRRAGRATPARARRRARGRARRRRSGSGPLPRPRRRRGGAADAERLRPCGPRAASPRRACRRCRTPGTSRTSARPSSRTRCTRTESPPSPPSQSRVGSRRRRPARVPRV